MSDRAPDQLHFLREVSHVWAGHRRRAVEFTLEEILVMDRLLQYFKWEHLPPHLQEVSRPCAELATLMVQSLHAGPETTAGLRKLLEAKDCFVRAALPVEPTEPEAQ